MRNSVTISELRKKHLLFAHCKKTLDFNSYRVYFSLSVNVELLCLKFFLSVSDTILNLKVVLLFMEYISSCNLCGSSDFRITFKVKDYNYKTTDQTFYVTQCKKCGLAFTNPRYSIHEIWKCYSSMYEPHSTSNSRLDIWNIPYIKNFLKKTNLWGLVTYIFSTNEVYIPDLPEGANVLELGCATGRFLKFLKQKYKWKLFGVEINENAAKEASQAGLDIFQGTLEGANYPSNYFDFIYAWHVIEHFHNPMETLQEVHRILKHGGTIAFSTPNFHSLERYLFKDKWYPLEIPRHLYFFTPKTIRLLLKKCGFRYIKIISQKTVEFSFRSFATLLRLSNLEKIAYCVEKGAYIPNWNIIFNPILNFLALIQLSCCITVVAKKL